MKVICKESKLSAKNPWLVPGKEYHARLTTGFHMGKHILRLTMDDDTEFIYGSIQIFSKEWKVVDDPAPALMETIAERDKRLEDLWVAFSDIPMNPETECIEEPFLSFEAGTHREEILHWFDKRYSKGVHTLLYGGRSDGSFALEGILNCLPKQPRSFDTSDDPGFWSDRQMILCPSETECEIVASFLVDVLSEVSDLDVHTGFFDPDEDAKEGVHDDFTGFYYIDFD